MRTKLSWVSERLRQREGGSAACVVLNQREGGSVAWEGVLHEKAARSGDMGF